MKEKTTDDIVRCLLCKKEMNADDFAEHAVNMHEDDVLDLISDDDIIDGLSEYVEVAMEENI